MGTLGILGTLGTLGIERNGDARDTWMWGLWGHRGCQKYRDMWTQGPMQMVGMKGQWDIGTRGTIGNQGCRDMGTLVMVRMLGTH